LPCSPQSAFLKPLAPTIKSVSGVGAGARGTGVGGVFFTGESVDALDGLLGTSGDAALAAAHFDTAASSLPGGATFTVKKAWIPSPASRSCKSPWKPNSWNLALCNVTLPRRSSFVIRSLSQTVKDKESPTT